jgi:Protein of unknown function (DUF2934)
MAKASRKSGTESRRTTRKRSEQPASPAGMETPGSPVRTDLAASSTSRPVDASSAPEPMTVGSAGTDHQAVASNPLPSIEKTPERRSRESRETADREPTDDEVARRAYEIYVSRGQEPGRHVEDWLQARRELNALRGRGPTA